MVAVIGLVVFLTGKVMLHYSSLILLLIFTGLYTWLVTLAMVHKKRMELKRPQPINLDYQPTVSIVIAAHNEETVIEQTIREMMRLDYPKYELLVMDDRSTDETRNILKRLAEDFGPQFRYHFRSEDSYPGKPAALNEALAITDSEIICVFDADAAVESDFLRRIIPFLADANVGAVQARKIIANAEENWLTRCQNYEYALDSHAQYGRDTIRGAVELRGNGQLVKREALEEVNGWNKATLTDDLDLSTRLHIAGWDIRFAHKVCVYEEGIPQFGALLKQRRRWTEGTLFRYLEYSGPLLKSKEVSLRTTLDMIAYFLEFMIPLWVFLDLVQLGLGFVVGDPSLPRILSSLFVLPVATIGIIIAMIIAIIRFHRPTVGHAILWGIITGFYMAMLWTPLVFGIMVKVLWQKQRRTRWDKTEHTGSAHKKTSVLVS
jgi:1,2-diacylglycerol 3-beta-glucosyltransferase